MHSRNQVNIQLSQWICNKIKLYTSKSQYTFKISISHLEFPFQILIINYIHQPNDFDAIQKKATTSFLATMGFNRHMPCEVVYCSKNFQGLGLRHLYDIQGTDSVCLLLQEINYQGTTSNMLQFLLEVVQMEAGIGRPILEDNRPLPYIKWGWIPAIRDFLLHINTKIVNATTIPPTF
jgi:hypothetical protein